MKEIEKFKKEGDILLIKLVCIITDGEIDWSRGRYQEIVVKEMSILLIRGEHKGNEGRNEGDKEIQVRGRNPNIYLERGRYKMKL